MKPQSIALQRTITGVTAIATVPSITLRDGVEIPQLGFGTYKLDPAETKDAVLRALEVGYRHIDTAQMYGNERQVGEAIAASGLDRGEVFVTSKLDNPHHAYDDALAAFDRTMDHLGFDQLDLFLIHWPLPHVGFIETWEAMEAIYDSGSCRAIGVSNFLVHHLETLLDETATVPVVNQVEVHPYLQQNDVRAYNAEHGIATAGSSPLARAQVVGDPTITAVADETGHTPAQVVLRWHLQRGDIVFPKSRTPERIAENFEVFDFELDTGQMRRITALERGRRVGSHPDEKRAP